MTSHVRHRRFTDPAEPFAAPMETGELAVNTANRQVAAGAPDGEPIALIAVRYFDEASQYATNDFVAHEGFLYSAIGPISPGPFNVTQWNKASTDPVDPTDLSAYLQKAGGTMIGALTLYGAPQTDLEAATKKYVDDSTPPPPPPPLANTVPFTPVGGIEATDVQAALAELDAEKVAKAGDTMTGHLTLAAEPVNDLHPATKRYTDTQISQGLSRKVDRAGDTMSGELVVNADISANRTPNTGVIFLGNNKTHYLHFDGTKYIMPAGGLDVGGVVNNAGANINGTLNVNQNSNFAQGRQHVVYTTGYFGSGPMNNFQVYGGPYPSIGFYCPGYFGANFGMNTDGNFYMGGHSHGEGVYYKFITTRDGAPVTSHRMVYVGDVQHNTMTPLTEPFPGASVTGMSGLSSPDGSSFHSMATYRQHQILINGGWYAVGYA